MEWLNILEALLTNKKVIALETRNTGGKSHLFSPYQFMEIASTFQFMEPRPNYLHVPFDDCDDLQIGQLYEDPTFDSRTTNMKRL